MPSIPQRTTKSRHRHRTRPDVKRPTIDDVILASGYRIGPFDVESVLITHPAVTDVAVVGRPDPEGIRGEIVEAYVVTSAPPEAHDALARELREHTGRTTWHHWLNRTITTATRKMGKSIPFYPE